MEAHQSRDVGVSSFPLAFLGWMDGKVILVPTTSLVFGASHAVSYVSIYMSLNMILVVFMIGSLRIVGIKKGLITNDTRILVLPPLVVRITAELS
jgi:hypothetical protein